MSVSRSFIDDLHSYPFIILQSSLAQSSIPILQRILKSPIVQGTRLLFCFLYTPQSLLNGDTLSFQKFQIYDWTGRMPDYVEDWCDPGSELLSIVKNAPPGPLEVIIDSLDTLSEDISSDPRVYRLLKVVLSLVQLRPGRPRLVVHAVQPCKMIKLIMQPTFSRSLLHLIAHPSALLRHLSTDYSTPPPPSTPDEKFWGIFLPISERVNQIYQLVFGLGGDGCGSSDFIVEVFARGSGTQTTRRSVCRSLEGWASLRQEACTLEALDSLKSIWKRTATQEPALDPTRGLPFNLNLTASQQESRAAVPLPYAHADAQSSVSTLSAIHYDPDSADDLDDDDPDEDLDI